VALLPAFAAFSTVPSAPSATSFAVAAAPEKALRTTDAAWFKIPVELSDCLLELFLREVPDFFEPDFFAPDFFEPADLFADFREADFLPAFFLVAIFAPMLNEMA
jgi:hypothetical protein